MIDLISFSCWCRLDLMLGSQARQDEGRIRSGQDPGESQHANPPHRAELAPSCQRPLVMVSVHQIDIISDSSPHCHPDPLDEDAPGMSHISQGKAREFADLRRHERCGDGSVE